MNKDGVSSAFELINEEIDKLATEIIDQGKNALSEKRFGDATRLSKTGEILLQFSRKIKDLREEWGSGIDIETRKRIVFPDDRSMVIKLPKKNKFSSKSKHTKLRVILQNGKVIQKPFAVDTFIETIRVIGIERVRNLGLTTRKLPLIGKQKSIEYTQHEADGYLICTHSSTEEKKKFLMEISNKLDVGLKVEII